MKKKAENLKNGLLMSMGDYRLKSFRKKAHTLEKLVFIFCLSLSIATCCAEPNTANPAHQLPEKTREEIPTGLPPRKSIEKERSGAKPTVEPDSDDEKLHTTCFCITH